MTTLTSPAPAATARPSTVPGLGRWLLRLHRPALCIWAGLVIVLSAMLLWLWGPLTDAAASAWQQYDACHVAAPCTYDQDAIIRYKNIYNYTTIAIVVVPFLVAAWAGAALTGRELETGTAQLAWTQSVSPVRWLTASLALPAVLVTAGTGLLVVLHHLAWSASRGRIDNVKTWYDSATFYANGSLTVTLALAGLALGALAGLIWRRSLAALVLAFLLVGGLRAVAGLVMPHLWPSVTRVSSLSHGYAGTGLGVRQGLVTSTGAHIPDQGCAMTGGDCTARFAKVDAVGFYKDYHPYSHYWPLQLTTSALVLVVTALLTLAAFRLVKRWTGTRR